MATTSFSSGKKRAGKWNLSTSYPSEPCVTGILNICTLIVNATDWRNR